MGKGKVFFLPRPPPPHQIRHYPNEFPFFRDDVRPHTHTMKRMNIGDEVGSWGMHVHMIMRLVWGIPHTHTQKEKKKKKVCMFGEILEVVNRPPRSPNQNISTLKNHHSICLGNHTKVEKEVGRCKSVLFRYWRKVNYQCREKNKILVTNIF